MISSSTGATWSSCLGERRMAISTVLSWTHKRSGNCLYSHNSGENSNDIGGEGGVCVCVCVLTGFPPRSIWGSCWTVTSSNWPSSDRGSMSFLPSRSCSTITQNAHICTKVKNDCNTDGTSYIHPLATNYFVSWATETGYQLILIWHWGQPPLGTLSFKLCKTKTVQNCQKSWELWVWICHSIFPVK